MTKRLLSITLVISICLCLSGCSWFTVDTAELLNPPALSGNIAPIADAIKKSTKVEYKLQYPSTGEYRSAVVQNDIDGDGKLEAFAFYSTVESDITTMHINVICQNNGKWNSVAQQKIMAGGVDKVNFCDLDGDGIKEILVGWKIYGTSEMQLAVYSFNKNKITQQMIEKYTNFVCCDLNEDGKNEVMIINLNTAEQSNRADLYEISDSGISEIYTCALDPTVQSINELIVSHLSSGRPAVYIDEIKGVGSVTEVLFIEKNQLVNPLYNVETRDTPSTLRASAYQSKDINNDGIIEIPVQESVPSVTTSSVNEKLYLIDWCSYNGESLTNQMTTLMNSTDGYYYNISSKWAGKIAILKDADNKVREIYEYNNETLTTGNKLLYIQTVKKSDWDNGKYKKLGLREITHNSDSSYICWVSDAALASGITYNEVSKNFILTDQS